MNNFIWITLIHLILFAWFGLYKRLWQYAGMTDLMQIGVSLVCAMFCFVAYSVFAASIFPRTVYIIYALLLTLAMFFSRLGHRLLLTNFKDIQAYLTAYFTRSKATVPATRTMLVGAGEAASIILKDLHNNPHSTREILLAVDDDTKKVGSSLYGIPVKGKTSEIVELAEKYEINEIIIAMPSISKKRTSELLSLCNKTNCKLKIFEGLNCIFDENKGLQNIKDVSIEDLLGRDEIHLDNPEMHAHIEGKTVLITGGGGSIGSELCRQIIAFQPKKLLLFDIAENSSYDLYNELLRKGYSSNVLQLIIGSVRDQDKLEAVFTQYKPHLVFHAAAHKHVPLMENNPEEAIKNNVFGTLNVVLCARKYQVEKFVLLSTDKAVNPTNVMGATKRICEMIIQSINATTPHTEYVAVRFGNVLGSNGSVIPLFKRQIEEGGPLTVTHPDIIRYFMTIPEAVRLILQSMSFASGGEIFVLDMGQPVKILDLARNLIKLSGLQEGKDIEIQFTGLRPGEKLYEELLMAEEGLTSTKHEKIFIAQPVAIEFDKLVTCLDTFQERKNSPESILHILHKLVPTYKKESEIA